MSTTSVRRKSKPSARRQPPRRQRSKETESLKEKLHQSQIPPFIHLVRLIVCGLGATTIVGTTTAVINPPAPPVTQKGKLPSPPKVKPSIPAIAPPANNAPKTLPLNSPQPQNPAPAIDPKKTKLDVKSTPEDRAATPGFPKSVFIKPSSIRP
jgi:hypothetical protein